MIPPSEKELEAGRQLGESVAKDLGEEIDEMGLPAVRAADQPMPDAGDIVLGGAVKAAGELSGRDTIEGAGRRTASLIVEELKVKSGAGVDRIGVVPVCSQKRRE